MMKKPGNYKNMIGDGKKPNYYWLMVSNDYEYYHHNEENESMVDWIGDLIEGFESKGEMIGRFDSYAEARQYADDNYYIGMDNSGHTVNRITIEDRLSGEVYEKTACFYPKKAKVEESEREYIEFTKEKLGADFK